MGEWHLTRSLKVRQGDFVRARSTTWIVENISDAGDVPTLDLVSVEDDSQGDVLRVASEAELDLKAVDTSDWSELLKSTFESPQRLGAHLRATEWRTATSADRRLFQAPFRSGIRLEQYQLLPLAKALELPRVNLLIADDVGLGKTIEAGLIVRELMLRRRLSFVVVAAPASMQSQWQDELSQKFGLDFTIVDREYLLESRSRRGFSANPWSIGSRFVVSHSVLADETYMSGLRDVLNRTGGGARSMLILDEAHHAAPAGGLAWATESQLTRAVREIAGPFEHRLFLSATPHNGHSNSFSTLLDILDPQRFFRGQEITAKDLEPVMVRRLKEDLRQLGHKFPERQVTPIVIDGLPQDAPELRLAAMLDDYRSGNMGGSRARFMFATLQQRLFSSIAAFDRTLRTHLRALQRKQERLKADANDADDVIESDDLIEEATVGARGELGDVNAAIAHVGEMLKITSAHRDQPDQRIERLLDWIEAEMLDESAWKDRRLILFTEWDDTRRWLVEQLEEGLLRRTRNQVDLNGRIVSFSGRTSLDERDRIKSDFNAPFDRSIRILVCTDAAREGLNLQTRCRDLIHIDLPWNPSRLEQRNGRIDRKLQPAKIVSCRYFLYTQRVEDRVLDTLIRKTEIIRKQLGTAGEVLRNKIEARLADGGIARADANKLAAEIENIDDERVGAARRDLDDEAERRIARLKEEQDRLQRRLEEARSRVGVDGKDLRRIVEIALADDGAQLEHGDFAVPEAVWLDPAAPAFSKDPTWAALFDDLRATRPPRQRDRAKWRKDTPVRGLVFDPPSIKDGEPEPQDIVQLHLEHRLVKRLVSRFASQGFRTNIGRVTAIVGAGAQPRVVLIGRLSLFGPDARRLHEEIIPVTAPWRDIRRDAPLEPFGDTGATTTITQLEEALRSSMAPGDGIIERLRQSVDADIADLRPHLEQRAEVAEQKAKADLVENGEREAQGLRDLLERQIKRVRESMRDTQPPAQLSFELFQNEEQKQQAEKEMRQFELDRRSWDDKLVRLQRDLDNEPQKVKDNYAVAARQLEPIGLVYLWPSTS
jgi:superfamily II DNA or RNA helicase